MYSFSAELLAFFITIMIFFFACRPGIHLSNLRKKFLLGLALNGLSILANFATLPIIQDSKTFPMWLNYLINSVYYALCFSTTFVFVTYLIEKILFHVSKNNPSKKIVKAMFYGLLVQFALLICNIPTRILFYYNEDNLYTRGPLWVIGYIQLFIYILILSFYIFKYNLIIDHEGKRLCYAGVPIITLLFIYQIFFPEILLNGTMGAYTALLCFFSFEAHSEDIDSISKRGNLTALTKDLEVLHQNKNPYHVILVSFRNYSSFNATFGFLNGNETLFRIGNYLENYFYKGKVYRFAPVAFAVVLPYENAIRTQNDFHDAITNLPRLTTMNDFNFQIQPYFVSLSNDHLDFTPTQVIEMLEYAKECAKQNFVYHLSFDEKMQQQFQRKKYLINYLQSATQEKKFKMWYQPIYCTSNQKFCSAEALLRLKDEDGYFISPEEFVPIAEEIGLIDKISYQTTAYVIDFLSKNDHLPIIQITINLSLQQLQLPDHIMSLFKLMDEKNVARDKIGYEITERMLITNDKNVKETLDYMKSQNCTFLLDDFGTGYSNFTSVLDYPFAKIKLDKSLLLKDTSDNYRMVSMMIRLFHEFGKLVVVEGVETKEQVDALVALGADYLQGFYFSRPLPEEDYIEFMLQHAHDGECK